MKKFKKKGFTLIELIAVLVILAILALIVTPLVMNIIRKARISADKRSIDAYGRSIEYAIATHLLDNLEFPTSIDELTIEYKGDTVVCLTTKINSDSSVYLAGCTVGGRSVDYTYGREESSASYTAYSVGDEVKYNNVDYYVIENSDSNKSSVKLLKKNPLTMEEVNQFGGVGTANNHVNMYVTNDTTARYYQTAYDVNNSGYGGMAYYSSETCAINEGNISGCTTDYEQSEIKYVVDAWKVAQAPSALDAGLITLNDLTNNWGIELNKTSPSSYQITVTDDTPTWVMGENYWYWTMTTDTDKVTDVWRVNIRSNRSIESNNVSFEVTAVRPVITISKAAL